MFQKTHPTDATRATNKICMLMSSERVTRTKSGADKRHPADDQVCRPLIPEEYYPKADLNFDGTQYNLYILMAKQYFPQLDRTIKTATIFYKHSNTELRVIPTRYVTETDCDSNYLIKSFLCSTTDAVNGYFSSDCLQGNILRFDGRCFPPPNPVCLST